MVNLKINGISVSVPENYTILQAAKEANVEIPSLCYLKDVNCIGACRVCVVEVKNRQFNDMHAKVNNINEILAHAHAACIKNLYQKTKCENVLIDKFANEYRMENELRELPLHITQRPKAEQNIAVAAASILARYTYMTRLKSMSEEYGIDFCAGAGTQADICANKFAEIYGKDKLYDICKISYKNTQRVK